MMSKVREKTMNSCRNMFSPDDYTMIAWPSRGFSRTCGVSFMIFLTFFGFILFIILRPENKWKHIFRRTGVRNFINVSRVIKRFTSFRGGMVDGSAPAFSFVSNYLWHLYYRSIFLKYEVLVISAEKLRREVAK